MSEEQKKRWDEANQMEKDHPNDPYVMEQAIRIRHEIIMSNLQKR
jgi:hypothetical protein